MKGRACLNDPIGRMRMREALTQWFISDARDFPWRNTNAWGRYVSEIMLQQTQTTTVVPYFDAFLETFPTPEALASASEDEVLKAWEGLGFYRRARNLQAAGRVMVELHDGEVPYDYAALRKLPGVGDYTAGALASFLSNARTPAIDGNVWRVMLRILAMDLQQGKAADRKTVENTLKDLLEAERPDIEVDAALINEALIELGAKICRPKTKALCELCPWQPFCLANDQEIVELLPQAKAAPIRPVSSWLVPILETPLGILIHERPDHGLLAGLYEFPMLNADLFETSRLEQTFSGTFESTPMAQITHLFSHREWQMVFYRGEVESFDLQGLGTVFDVDSERLLIVKREELFTLPMPAYLNGLRILLNA